MVWYALATYRLDGSLRPGIVFDDRVFDLAELYGTVQPASRGKPSWLNSVDSMLADWLALEPEIDSLARKCKEVVARGGVKPALSGMEGVAAPFTANRIFAAAANYIEHANEMGTKLAAKTDRRPYVFLKASSSVVGPGEPVRMPPRSKMVDWEVELGAVIGGMVKDVGVDEAWQYVAGYTIVNDVTARDLNKRDDSPFKFDWFQGKSFDTFAPLGPWFVPRSCIPDPHALRLTLAVNGEMMQDGTTAEMIYTVQEQIAYLSEILTLEPGDVLATGTPTGVGMSRGVFLKEGDVMVAAIENIGTLETPVMADAGKAGAKRDVKSEQKTQRAAGV